MAIHYFLHCLVIKTNKNPKFEQKDIYISTYQPLRAISINLVPQYPNSLFVLTSLLVDLAIIMIDIVSDVKAPWSLTITALLTDGVILVGHTLMLVKGLAVRTVWCQQ